MWNKKSKTNKNNIQTHSGFTLVELIVSLGLFAIVMTISSSALLSLADLSRKVQSTRIAFDNLNLALESMSREIRMGVAYNCNRPTPLEGTVTLTALSPGLDCESTPGNSIAFYSQEGNTVVYKQTGTKIQRSRIGGEPASLETITSPEIIIDNLSFYVFGAALGGDQPRVIISVKGTAGTGDTKSAFTIQTSVTQRKPDE